MSTYLIDYENVKSAGLAGINHIRKEDSVHLFWSSRENKISIEMMELIRSSESEIVMHKAFTGEKDALDHQLCSYFGYLAGSEGELDFVIVSNDRAYDRLIEFWGMLKPEIRIRRVTEIARISEAAETSEIFSEIEDTSLDGTGEGRSNRNARRRGSKYLRGGKNNFSRKNRNPEMSESEQNVSGQNVSEQNVSEQNTSEPETETEAAEPSITSDLSPAFSETEVNPALLDETDKEEIKTDEAVSSVKLQTEKPVKTERTGKRNRNRKQVYAEPSVQVSAVAESTEEYKVEKTEKTTVKPTSSYVVNVISGIKTGIVVESGFTADGILDGKYDSRRTAVKEIVSSKSSDKTAEKVKAETVKMEATAEAVEKFEKTGTEAMETGEVSDKAGTEAVKTAEETEKTVDETDSEKEAAAETVKEEAAETEIVKEEAAAETEAVKEEAAETETVKKEAAAEAEAEKPEETAKTVESFEKIRTEVVKEKEITEETAEDEKETAAGETEPETAEGNSVALPEETGTEAEQKSANTRKKAARRGRPPKKAKPVNVQEKKPVVLLQDVIANCKEAEQADWAPELVNRINSAGDKKELYAATVKLLGQEKGRTIYHMIKGLK